MGGKNDSSNEIPETSAERANARVAAAKLTRYFNVFRPFEMKAINSVVSDSSALNTERLAGERLNANTAQNFNQQTRPVGGADPSRGNVQGRVVNPEYAAIIAQSAAEVAGLGREQKLSGLMAATAIGQKQSADVSLGFQDLAGDALARAAADAEANWNNSAYNANTIGSAVGVIGALAQNDPSTGG